LAEKNYGYTRRDINVVAQHENINADSEIIEYKKVLIADA
jgi:hypothetical protein